ncbi:MAG TPA: protein kinase [Candidatus Eremiobacteraeota bacterium]|nr:protein kinase [Candidatus Eremiobacteraeota bacterium]
MDKKDEKSEKQISEDRKKESPLESDKEVSETIPEKTSEEVKKRKIVRTKVPSGSLDSNGVKRIKYSTKRLSRDKLEEYLESQPEGKKKKIIIKKKQKKGTVTEKIVEIAEEKSVVEIAEEKPVEVAEEKPVEVAEEKPEEVKPDVMEKSYIDLAADYALPTSEAGDIKEEELVPSDWKERKKKSYKKKPEGPPLLKPFKEGSIIEDRYEILENLHEDRTGVFYKVKDLREQEERKQIKSLKEVHYISERISSEVMSDSLKGLVKMTNFLTDVDHPNLARIYECFTLMEEKGARFFTLMEYIEGNTLEELLKVYSREGHFLPMKTIFGIMEKICEALYYLHNKKPFPIGFGDLKPSNIMLSLDGSIKFVNYGIGSFFDTDKDGAFTSRGTLGYAAPEQRGIDFTNTKADIFALGVTVYYMLTGVDPEENPYEFKPLRKHKRFVSEKVQRFLDRCLEVHPDNRPDIKAVKKLTEKMDYHEFDMSTLTKKEEEKKEEPVEEIPPPQVISQEKVQEIITDFKVQNPFIASWYGIVAIIIILGFVIYSSWAIASYISSIPRKGTFLYLTADRLNTIMELNLVNLKFRDFVDLPINPGPIVYSQKNHVLYVASTSDSIIYEVDVNNGKILRDTKKCKNPSYMLLSKDEEILYVINSTSGNISFIRTETFREGRSPAGVGKGPYYASISLYGDRIFVINDIDESVSVFDTTDNIVLYTLTFKGEKPKGVTGDKDRIYTALSASNKVVVSDGKGEFLKDFSVSKDPVVLLINPKDRLKLYVISGTGNSIEVFDTNNFLPGGEQKFLGFKAEGAVFSEDGRKLYIVGENNYIKTSAIGIYDVNTGKLDVIKNNALLNYLVFSSL